MDKIEEMKTLIKQLEELGQEEVTEQIQALKEKVAELEARAIADVQEIVTEVEKIKVGFWVKYRVELIVAALLVISHIASKCGM